MPNLHVTVEKKTLNDLRRRARQLERMADYLPAEVIAADVASMLAREIVEQLDLIEASARGVVGETFVLVVR